jgi:hypothetical protein
VVDFQDRVSAEELRARMSAGRAWLGAGSVGALPCGRQGQRLESHRSHRWQNSMK